MDYRPIYEFSSQPNPYRRIHLIKSAPSAAPGFWITIIKNSSSGATMTSFRLDRIRRKLNSSSGSRVLTSMEAFSVSDDMRAPCCFDWSSDKVDWRIAPAMHKINNVGFEIVWKSMKTHPYDRSTGWGMTIRASLLKPEGNENVQCPILPSFVIMTTPSTPLMALILAIVSSTSVAAAVVAIVVLFTRV